MVALRFARCRVTVSSPVSLSGLRSGEGDDERVEHGLNHGGLASGRVVAFVECNSRLSGIYT